MQVGEDGSVETTHNGQSDYHDEEVEERDTYSFGQSHNGAGHLNEIKDDINEELGEDGSNELIQDEERDWPDEEVEPWDVILENEEEAEQQDDNSIVQSQVHAVAFNEHKADRHYVNIPHDKDITSNGNVSHSSEHTSGHFDDGENRFESLEQIIQSWDDAYIDPVSTTYSQGDSFKEEEYSEDDADSLIIEIQDDNTSVKELYQFEMDHLNNLESNSTLVNSDLPDSFNSEDGPGTLTEDKLKGLIPSNPSSLSSVQENSISGTFSSFNQSIISDQRLDINIVQDPNYSLANHKTLEDFLRPGSFGSLESVQTYKKVQQQATVDTDEIRSLSPIDQNNIAGLIPSNPSSLNSDQENDISGSFKGLIPENLSSLDSIEEETV